MEADRAGAGGRVIARLEGVSKAFGALKVLRSVTLGFEERKTTVVLGPSGAGKSVLLKHLVGLLEPDNGEVWFRDARVDHVSEAQRAPIRRQIGFVFQLSALFDSMTVGENVAFPLTEHTALMREELAAKIEEALAMVGLSGAQPKLPSQLSGGQKKRVALARAIVLRPALVLYDEPTTGLDPIRADGINELIVRMRDQLGVTGVVVTHDLAAARKVADRVVVLYHGQIIADGTFGALDASAHPYVKRFLAGEYDPELDDPAPVEQRT